MENDQSKRKYTLILINIYTECQIVNLHGVYCISIDFSFILALSDIDQKNEKFYAKKMMKRSEFHILTDQLKILLLDFPLKLNHEFVKKIK